MFMFNYDHYLQLLYFYVMYVRKITVVKNAKCQISIRIIRPTKAHKSDKA